MINFLIACTTSSSATASSSCYSWPVIKQIIWLFTYAIKYIYDFLGLIGIANIGLTVILFTLIVKFALLPLTIKQQKFTKLTNVMQPEINAVQQKYKGRNDSYSMQAMQEETKAIYAKYGVSQAGGCIQSFVQFPFLIALYGAIREVPNVITSIGDTLSPVANAITNASSTLQTAISDEVSSALIGAETADVVSTLYSLPTSSWNKLLELFSNQSAVNSAYETFRSLNSFLGWDLSQSPFNLIKSGGWGIVAVLIPLFAGFTQWLSFKLTQTAQSSKADNQMAATNRSMSLIMPLISVFFCFSLSLTLGLYWCLGSVFQVVLQIFINRHYRRVGMEAILERAKAKAEAKAKKKRESGGVSGSVISQAANINTKNLDPQANIPRSISDIANMDVSGTATKKNYKKDSLAEKAGLVEELNLKEEESQIVHKKYKK